MTNAQRGPNKGSVDLVILKTLKSHPLLDGKDVVRIPRYVPIEDPKNPPQLLVFFDVFKGELDPFSGPPADESVVKYVEGLMAWDGKDRASLLRYCFDFLRHANLAVAEDAHREFRQSKDADLRKAAPMLAAAELRRGLSDKKTPDGRRCLFALLLAHVGNREDAALVRKLLGDLASKQSDDDFVVNAFVSYTILNPKEGWEHSLRAINDGDPSQFMLRYNALRAARQFLSERPGIVSEKEVLHFFDRALDQPDIADFAADYLRLEKQWVFTGKILSLPKKKGYEMPIIQRSVLRYAIQCPDPLAVRYAADAKMADREYFNDIVELLNIEGK